ncbi:MAG: HlyD family efflux transporter periplasmic adaptor subunit [Sterolibacterium sp.]
MNSPQTATDDTNITSGKRRRVMMSIASVFLLLGFGFTLYWLLVSRHYEDTDNAYVQGNVVQVTPQIAGTVVRIHADDTDLVKAGQVLISLDPADARVAAEQAEAQLAQTVREVRTLYTTQSQSAAVLTQRQAELARTEDDLTHRRNLAGTGAVSGEELRHAEASLNVARAAVTAAREQLASGRALTEGSSVRDHPNVMRAAARLHEALLAQQRTALLAPVSGQVAKRNVQVGQRINPGAPLMAIVPLDRLWVDANFKEAQLRNMRVGQVVKLTSDLYGSDVQYTGKVLGLAAGTGGAFALLPAQNASGNWIKVVQRVPVRIALEPQQLTEHPLRIGLSMHVEVDLHEQAGLPLAAAREATGYSSESPPDDKTLARIQAVIAANLK